MEFLHSYWRMQYLEAPKESKDALPNLFQSIHQTTDDKSVYIIYRSEHTFIIMNKYPYNAGHLLVVPYEAVATLGDMNMEQRMDFMNMMVKAQDILQKALNPHGFNIGINVGSAAGAGIPQHIHCHIVPRWNGDTNFMPIIANTKVIPQAMEAMWERLVQFK